MSDPRINRVGIHHNIVRHVRHGVIAPSDIIRLSRLWRKHWGLGSIWVVAGIKRLWRSLARLAWGVHANTAKGAFGGADGDEVEETVGGDDYRVC